MLLAEVDNFCQYRWHADDVHQTFAEPESYVKHEPFIKFIANPIDSNQITCDT